MTVVNLTFRKSIGWGREIDIEIKGNPDSVSKIVNAIRNEMKKDTDMEEI